MFTVKTNIHVTHTRALSNVNRNKMSQNFTETHFSTQNRRTHFMSSIPIFVGLNNQVRVKFRKSQVVFV
jgi:hypothetical protein